LHIIRFSKAHSLLDAGLEEKGVAPQHIELNYSDINAGANLGPKREPTM
jgi:hypothetical protein